MKHLDAHCLITIRQVTDLVTLSRAEIQRRVHQGRFPPPIRLGPGRVAWLYKDVRSWISDMAEFGEWLPGGHGDAGYDGAYVTSSAENARETPRKPKAGETPAFAQGGR